MVKTVTAAVQMHREALPRAKEIIANCLGLRALVIVETPGEAA